MTAARNWSIVVLCLAAASCSKCSKKPALDADAAPEGGAVTDADVDAAADAAPEAAVVEDAAAPLASATAVHASGGPFAGSYRCFGGLTLTQNGNLVSGVTVDKSSTSTRTTQWNCSVIRPDRCEGTEVVTVRFTDKTKPPKVIESRKLQIDHRPDGVAVHLERSTETTFCRK
jgi:hypothetical protein